MIMLDIVFNIRLFGLPLLSTYSKIAHVNFVFFVTGFQNYQLVRIYFITAMILVDLMKELTPLDLDMVTVVLLCQQFCYNMYHAPDLNLMYISPRYFLWSCMNLIFFTTWLSDRISGLCLP